MGIGLSSESTREKDPEGPKNHRKAIVVQRRRFASCEVPNIAET